MPECYADTLLIDTLVPAKKGYNHQHSCFNVEREMMYGKLKNQFAVGIIDNDKLQVNYLREFEEIDKVLDSLILWKHPTKDHYIIQVCPALEGWLWNVCKKGEIKSFEFAQSIEKLKVLTKTKTSIKDSRLKNLFKEISQREDLIEVRKLKGWIKLLKEKNYQVDINELKNV